MEQELREFEDGMRDGGQVAVPLCSDTCTRISSSGTPTGVDITEVYPDVASGPPERPISPVAPTGYPTPVEVAERLNAPVLKPVGVGRQAATAAWQIPVGSEPLRTCPPLHRQVHRKYQAWRLSTQLIREATYQRSLEMAREARLRLPDIPADTLDQSHWQKPGDGTHGPLGSHQAETLRRLVQRVDDGLLNRVTPTSPAGGHRATPWRPSPSRSIRPARSTPCGHGATGSSGRSLGWGCLQDSHHRIRRLTKHRPWTTVAGHGTDQDGRVEMPSRSGLGCC